MFDLACIDQFLHRTGHIFDRNVRIDAMLIEQIDTICSESFQRGVGDLLDVFGPAVERRILTLRSIRSDVESELRCDHDLITKRRERFADELFVCERTVDFGRVKKSDARLTAARISAIASSFSVAGP
jgi:hypothetical protein